MAIGATIGATIIGGIVSDRSSRRAARTANNATQAGIDNSNRQFDITRNDLNPFLEAATGGPVTGGERIFDEARFLEAEKAFEIEQRALAGNTSLSLPDRLKAAKKLSDGLSKDGFFNTTEITNGGGGALEQFQQGINETPEAPTIDQFSGQAVDAPNLQQFNADIPNLQSFNFDPNKALNDPSLAFQRQQGEQQLDRISGKNRQLNSGQRLIDAVKFGQGLASQSLDREFSRQLTENRQGNQVNQQNFGNSNQINSLQNSIIGQNQQFDRQNLSDRLNLSNVNQNRLIQQFGLDSNRSNQRLDRLSGLINVGARTGQGLGSLGANNANNISGLLQQQGQTNAAGQLGRANNINNVIQQGVGAAAQFGLFDQSPSISQRFGTNNGSQQTNLLAQQQFGF